MPKSKPIEERFFSKIQKQKSCWLWNASRMPKGYGQLNDKGKVWRAHRLSWVIHYGPIPENLFVCHSCDNPPCVNPKHLWLGTRSENMKDMILKGRFLTKMARDNINKTECPKGHEYNTQNTYVCSRGKRSCRICRKENDRLSKLRKRNDEV